MCTVTFIPKGGNHFIFTSNRDESPERNTYPPSVYQIDGTRVLFPKDAVAGGTWIGVSERKRLVCLLNGGFTAHDRLESYRMSRGVIVRDLLVASDANNAILDYDFKGVEPFTLIVIDWQEDLQLYELVWDGMNSHLSQKPNTAHIWSSSLLYSQPVKMQREDWFAEFLKKETQPPAQQVLDFHRNAGIGNRETDLVMDRGFVKTKSITQVVHTDETLMKYEDLIANNVTNTIF